MSRVADFRSDWPGIVSEIAAWRRIDEIHNNSRGIYRSIIYFFVPVFTVFCLEISWILYILLVEFAVRLIVCNPTLTLWLTKRRNYSRIIVAN